jgi:hypothetical protein
MTHGVSPMAAAQSQDVLPRRLALDEREGITYALYRDLALREGAIHSRAVSWACELERLPDLGAPVASGRNEYSDAQLVRRGAVICHVRVTRGLAHASLAAGDRDLLDGAERELREILLTPALDDGGRSVTVRFWNERYGEARSTSRRIEVPHWEAIQNNYPPSTVSQLTPVMTSYRPGPAGQLLTWHGPPGTGKTFALRALLWEWRDWCDGHYVVDPESFLGPDSDYLVDLLTRSIAGPDARDAYHDALEDRPAAARRTGSERWRLLILEDSGELLSVDAKERKGQAISRLLNIVDGLIGQDLRLLILITANEPLRELHPALSRVGRCASVVEFGTFTPDGAAAWLASHGASIGSAKSDTLSDLYAVVRADDRRIATAPRRVGFG